MFDFCDIQLLCQGTPTMTEPVTTAVWRQNMCIGASLLTSEGKDKPSSTQGKKEEEQHIPSTSYMALQIHPNI